MPKRNKRPRPDDLATCDGTGCTRTLALNWNVGRLAKIGLFCDRAACRREAGVSGVYQRLADRPPSPPRDDRLRHTNYAAPLHQQIPRPEARPNPPPPTQHRPYVPAKQPRLLNAAIYNTAATAGTSSAPVAIVAAPTLPTAVVPIQAVPLASAVPSITARLIFTIDVAFAGMHGHEPSECELRAQVERCLNLAEGEVMRSHSTAFTVARAAAVALHAERAIALHDEQHRTQARVIAALKDVSARRQALHPRDVNVQ